MPPPTTRSAFRIGFMLALAVAALAGAWLARQEILLGVLAVLVAVVFSFPVGWLSRLVPRGVAVLLVLGLVAGAAAGVGAAAAPTLARQFRQLTENAPRALRQAQRWFDRVQESSPGGGGGQGSGVSAEKAVTQAIGQAKDTAAPALAASVAGITAVVLVLVLAAFLVHGPDQYRRGVRRLVPPPQRNVFDDLWNRLGNVLRRWVGGILVAMTIMGTLTALGLLAVGIEDWFLLGVLTFLGTFVPYLGAVASAVPGLLLALAQSPHHFLLALLVYVGVHVVEGYIVEPFVMKRAVEIKPALLLFGQGVIGAIFGPLGIVVATPIIVCTQVVLDVLWVERRLQDRAA